MFPIGNRWQNRGKAHCRSPQKDKNSLLFNLLALNLHGSGDSSFLLWIQEKPALRHVGPFLYRSHLWMAG
jgi:hypothetical protein